MRFTTCVTAFGLIAAACAVPVEVANPSLDARGLELNKSEYTLDIKYAAFPSKDANLDQERMKEMALSVVKACADKFAKLKEAKEKSHEIKVKPSNTWHFTDQYVAFSFDLPECKGKPCSANAQHNGHGTIDTHEKEICKV